MKSTGRLASIAAAGLLVGGIASAQAADLGGDCCADLEERVAELEATTARKGNRKVSLTVYGQVTTGVMWWKADSTVVNETNTYVVDPQTSGTRFGFRGSAKISSDWEAGYNLELQWQPSDATKVTSSNDDVGDLPEFRQSYWYLKSATLGRIAVGFTDMATSSIAEIDLSAAYIADGMSSSQAGSAIINEIIGFTVGNYELNRFNVVRYDTPTFAGFVFSAAWGEDDMWDIALRYAGEFGGFKVAAGIGYSEDTDSSVFTERTAWDLGVSVMHVPSGLFVSGSAGERETDGGNAGPDVDEDFWHLVAGIEQKWFPIGKTTLFGMGGRFTNDTELFLDREAKYWGLGAVQQIDAAAMELYISYRRYDLDGDIGAAGGLETGDFDVVLGGGRIKF